MGVALLVLVTRGRPRVNCEAVAGFRDTPIPPTKEGGIIGKPNDKDDTVNPWHAIISSVVHAPEAHVVKVIRALAFAARAYGTDAQVPGAFFTPPEGEGQCETHKGIGKLDGRVFVRAAGVVMDVMGWTGPGNGERGKVGEWDRSALGWEDAWK
jgi:hypothetical protein